MGNWLENSCWWLEFLARCSVLLSLNSKTKLTLSLNSKTKLTQKLEVYRVNPVMSKLEKYFVFTIFLTQKLQ